MSSMRTSDRQTGRMIVVIAVLAATIVSSFLPALAWAAQVTERSIELSTSAKTATGVSYKFTFTPVANAAGFNVDFCSNTPLIGEACTAPAGFDVMSSTTPTGSWSVSAEDEDANTTTLTGTLTAATPITVELANVTNPDDAGPLYARIVTYSSGNVGNYVDAENLGTGVVDTGSVALSITDEINVSGAVLETMSFCVAGEAIPANCDLTGLAAPTLELGQDVGGVIALNPDDVYEGTIYSQISTNAANGAVVSLKSNAINCGGLIRSSDPSACDIAPALNTDIANGEAKFGVKLGANVTDPTDGDFRAVPASNYNDTTYALNYVSGNATGVTSVYGDPILDTNGAPANNRNMPLTFGASVTNNTPAGSYSATLSLIATGKF